MLKIGGAWLSASPRPRAGTRLFCLPHAGGWSAMYQAWGRSLGPAVDVCPVELPGRGRRRDEAAYDLIEELVSDLGAALVPALDVPFAFFGHSMGALVSFELARWLQREGHPSPAHVFVSACAAPHVPRDGPALSGLPSVELVRELSTLNGMAPEVLENFELMELLLPAIRSDFSMCERYAFAPSAPLACPLSALGGTGDELVSKEKLEAWRTHTTGRFVTRLFRGDHFYLQEGERSVLDVVLRELLIGRGDSR
jgi:medium-chain acyl-[acyl-carrier-protein] hydrolase